MNRTKETMTGVKFGCVDLLDMMGRVLEAHTEHYRSDFDIDREILWAASGKTGQQDRAYVWLCRKSGTWLLRERDLYIRDSRENHTFRFYREQTSEPVIVMAVEVTGHTADTVIGSLYTADYGEYYRHVADRALPAGSVVLSYEGGSRTLEPDAPFDAYPDCRLGKFLSFEYQPDSPRRLGEILWDERYRRSHYEDGDADKFMAVLGLV